MSYILGISAFYHDAAACLLKNGKIVAAGQEERFSRIKHDQQFPKQAINFCLKEAHIDISKIDLIVFYEKPFLKFDRIINSLQKTTPFAFNLFRKVIKSWTKTKLWIPVVIKKELNYDKEIIFSEHHEAHAAGSFFTSPYTKSAIITMDGVGEKACTTIGVGEGNKVTILTEQHYPHSFGLLYSAFTHYCGFRVNSGEYKLMGLAPYGKPIYKDLILENFVTITKKGEVILNLKYFSFEKGNTTINNEFCSIFKRPARLPDEEIDAFYKDVASSIQSVTEDFISTLANYAKEITGLDALCMSGGIALNCKANGELLLEEDLFKNIWVQPASGDSGTAIGAAYIGWYHYLGNKREVVNNSLVDQVYLGPSFTDEEIETLLRKYAIQYDYQNNEVLCNTISTHLENKRIIGWFQGRMEFGPRALGNRSILANPLYEDMKSHVNMRIKKREGFRPFAPIVLKEKAKDWFINCKQSKYMLFTFKSDMYSKIPSCIHEDNTARVQTLEKEDNPLLHQLISKFDKKTQCPVLINTSFNVRGEPIVAFPEDALKCFFQTDMDVLVLGNFIILKSENATNIDTALTEIKEYALD